jgi:hypothetical protein
MRRVIPTGRINILERRSTMSLLHCNRTGNTKRKPTRSCPSLEALEQRLQLSTFKVNTTLDTLAVNLHTGKDASGHISLRSAIMAADAHGGSSTIIVIGDF